MRDAPDDSEAGKQLLQRKNKMASISDEATTEPLLGQEDNGEVALSKPLAKRKSYPCLNANRVLIQLCILIALLDFSGYLVLAPQTMIFENIVCDKYYMGTEKERDCKAVAVQSELASIRGWKDAFAQLPGVSDPRGWAREAIC
jgi:hypothetical protein